MTMQVKATKSCNNKPTIVTLTSNDHYQVIWVWDSHSWLEDWSNLTIFEQLCAVHIKYENSVS